MWNALRVLLHRPLLSDGDLQVNFPATSKSSFATCSEAATNIVEIVRLYDKAFSVRRAPYLISYATYVAATIHVRIAATQQTSSQAHDCLRACFFVFDQNSETNYAVRKASMVVEALCKRMGVSNWNNGSRSRDHVSDGRQAQIVYNPTSAAQHTHAHPTANTSTGLGGSQLTTDFPPGSGGGLVPALDVDAIMHNFMQDQQVQPPLMGVGPFSNFDGQATANPNNSMPYVSHEMDGNTGYPMLDDAIFGFNASAFDWLYPNTMTS